MTTSGGGTPKVASIANSAGIETYTYYHASVDYRRRPDTVTDRNGTQTKHTYAEVTDPVTGQPASVHTITEAVGLPEQRITTEVRDLASNRLLSITVGDREVRYAYNARLQPSSITVKNLDSAQTRVTTFTYCEAGDVSAPGSTCPIEGLPKAADGPRTDVPDVTMYAYYPSDDASCATAPASCPHRKGDLWKTTNALGQVTEILAYDGAGRPLSVKDPNGVVTDFEYHARGWPTAQKVRGTDNATESDDRVTRIEYWPTGLVKKVVAPDGAFTSFTYDAAQRLTDVTDNAGNTIHYTLDNAGNRLQEEVKDPDGTLRRTLSRVYNQLGQLETLADAQANPTDLRYDADGNPDTVTDALSRGTDHDYDPLNRLKRTLQDVSGIAAETKFEYDALDNLTKVTDPKGLATGYVYNGFGDLTQLTSPDTGVTSYTYDSDGNRKTRTDARGKQSIYNYDALNRLTGVTYATAGLNVTYTYDVNQGVCPTNEQFPVGRLTRMKDGSGTTQYCYGRFGQLMRKVQTTGGKVFTIRYAYTKSGQPQAVTYPDGTRVDYVRNTVGQITEVGVTRSGGTREVLLTGASYLPFGPATGWTYGNGRHLQRSHDQDYRPVAILDERAGGLSLGFGFDPVGNVDTLTTATNPAPLANFDYDALNRLTHFRDGPTQTPIESYAYDKSGNRRSFTNSAGTQTYTYPTTSHRLTKVGAVSRSYSAAGSTTAIGGTARQFAYDATGRMSQAKRNGAVVMNYLYNGRGERVRRYLGTANTYTVYDEAGRWLGDYDNTGAPLQQAIWLDDLPVGLLAGSLQQLQYIEPDHLGTPRAVIDPVRDMAVWKWDIKSEVFGNSPPQEDPDADGTAFVFDMRFPGQSYDSATGLNYNYFRDYDPGTGRYVESDPIGLTGGVSTYAYVGENPVNAIDPYGLFDVRAYGLPNGRGYQYTVTFYSARFGEIQRTWGPSAAGGISRIGKWIGRASKLFPDPAGVSRIPDKDKRKLCDSLDADAERIFNEQVNETYSYQDQASMERFLDAFFAAHPEMASVYRGGAQGILEDAQSRALGWGQ